MVPQPNKSAFRIIKNESLLVPGFWKEPQIPTLNMWKIQMMDSVAYEKMCGRLNFYNDMVNEQWDSLIDI